MYIMSMSHLASSILNKLPSVISYNSLKRCFRLPTFLGAMRMSCMLPSQIRHNKVDTQTICKTAMAADECSRKPKSQVNLKR